MKIPIRSILIPLALTASIPAMACCDLFENAYLEHDKTVVRNRKRGDGEKINDDNVKLSRELALQNFIAKNRDLLPDMPPMHPGLSTQEAEELDYLDALRKRFPKISGAEREKMLNTYLAVAKKMRDDQKCDLNLIPPEMEEFRLYLEGANEIIYDPGKNAPEAWKKLLALPPEKRHYRTTWVHFTLGSAFKQDIDLHFKNLREASKQGFRDTCGLGLRSYVVKYRFAKDPVERIRAAVAASTAGDKSFSEIRWGNKYSGFTFDKLDDEEYARLVSDPLCREICAIFSNSEKFRKTVLADGKKLRNADICAYYSYREFKIDEAQAFLKLLEKDTLLSCWVAAKVARYRDNIPGAVKHLRRYFEILSKLPDSEIKNQSLVLTNGKPFASEVYALIGTTKVLRRDFNEAAQLFFKAHSTDDLATIIERYFTLEEAEKFISKTRCHTDEDYNCLAKIKYVTGRRAFREGKYLTALHLLPLEERQYVINFTTYLDFSADTSSSDDERAFYLYKAAKILRYRGMELSGTQGWPDYFPGNFGYSTPCAHCVYDRHTGVWQLCESCKKYDSPDEYRGFNAVKDQLTVNRRFHYRYRAAELALKAGDLAKSKHLKALFNMFGGKCLEKSHQEADIFYKRLVNDSRGTEISRVADNTFWFPLDPELDKEISSIEVCKDVIEAKALMKKVFTSKPEPKK